MLEWEAEIMTYKRVEEKTPSGGDYSEIHYLDKFGNPTDEENAVRCIVRECRSDGKLVSETFGLLKK